MLHQARRVDTKGLFYFTTYDKFKVETVVSTPIWRRADRQELVPLFFVD